MNVILVNKRPALIMALLCFLGQFSFSQVRLPRLVSDGMVLQRGTRVNIWGWAAPGEPVKVRFNHRLDSALTGPDGKWTVRLSPMVAGGPYDMVIEGSNRVIVHNILVGDVWVCSGQSNMVLPMERVKERYPKEIAQSANPAIRHFFVPTRYDFSIPQDDLPPGHWESADPNTVLQFTAAGYFFAKTLFERYHIPIGLINTSSGGAPVESWMSEEALQEFPDYLRTAKKFRDPLYTDSLKKIENDINKDWEDRISRDSGMTGKIKWYDAAYDASAWPTMPVPGYWDEHGLPEVNGVVWFSKEVEIPASMTGMPVKLFLGTIVDRDLVYVNGAFVGTTGYQYPPRRYVIPAGLLKAGKNRIVIRVINNEGRGGFTIEKNYSLTAGGSTIDLKGDWQYKVGLSTHPMHGGAVTFSYQPLGLYNGMIAPLLNYTIKGVIWYQGEGNVGRASEYRRSFPALIADWRQHWRQGSFPFIFAQLHNYGEVKKSPSESSWAELREAQLQTLSAPNTAMAVTIDVGEWNDLHPLDKQDVGKRLALAAEHLAYGDKKIVYSGPLYTSMKIEGDRIRLSFSNTGSGLMSRGGDLRCFAIAGADGKFVWADAKIEGNTVLVRKEGIREPVAVRYAWSDSPGGANLYNREGLPASPFRTDDGN